MINKKLFLIIVCEEYNTTTQTEVMHEFDAETV